MGYEMPIVCKEVYLPCEMDAGEMTLEQYKDKYGIDLRDIFDIRLSGGNSIYVLSRKLIKAYLVSIDIATQLRVVMPNSFNKTLYISGNEDGYSEVGWMEFFETYGFGLRFSIDKDADFAIENLVVSAYEM